MIPLFHMKKGVSAAMPNDYAIKLAAPEHLPLLNAIELAAAAIFPPNTIPQHILSERVPFDILKTAQNAGMLWVALSDGNEPVGYALLQIVDGFALLAQMDVHPVHGRRGLGTALVHSVAAHAQEIGLRDLYLTTFADVVWNAPFYRKFGFESVEASGQPGFIQAILREEDERGLRNRVAMRLRI